MATKKKETELIVTGIKIHKVNSKKSGTLKAFVDITFNDCLVCKGFSIINGKNGLFVSKPSNKGSDDEYYDQIYMLDGDLWSDICNDIINEYEEV